MPSSKTQQFLYKEHFNVSHLMIRLQATFYTAIPRELNILSESKERGLEGADRRGNRHGVFILAQPGETIAILNDEQFQPENW